MESLWPPSEMKKSDKQIRVANGNVEKVEGEGPFGGEPALVTSSFGSMLIPASAVTKHSAVLFVENRMIVLPKRRCSYHISQIQELVNKNSPSNHFFNIERKNGIYPISTEVARRMVKGPVKVKRRTKVANSASYFTVSNDKKLDLVKYWHEALGRT